MNSSDIQALYYITPLANLEGIFSDGILSHRRAHRKTPEDASNSAVQARRATKRLQRTDPEKTARSIHSYVNLYLQPHNAMMWNLVNSPSQFHWKTHADYAILVIARAVLQKPGAILSTRNAAADRARFMEARKWEIGKSKRADIESPLSGTRQDFTERRDAFERKKQVRQAEALIPQQVPKEYIIGCIVSNTSTQTKVEEAALKSGLTVPVTVNGSYFFYREGAIVPFLPLQPEPVQSTEGRTFPVNELTSSQEEEPSSDPPIFLVESDSEEEELS